MLQVARNGAFVISRDGSILWWLSNSSMVVASNPVLQLLDTGNLVLADKKAREPEGNYIWQSFDHPSDTRLPGMFMVQSLDAGEEKYLTSWRSSDDPSPGDFAFVEPQVKRCVQVGLLCVQKLAEDRPTMSSDAREQQFPNPKSLGFSQKGVRMMIKNKY